MTHSTQFIEIIPTKEQWEVAKKLTDEKQGQLKEGHFKGSIEKGAGTPAGYLAQIISSIYCKGLNVDTYEYDIQTQEYRVDSKAKRQTVDYVLASFEASVTADAAKQTGCDIYFFSRVNENLNKVWLLGWLPKKTYLASATLRRAGEKDPNDPTGIFVFKRDCWNLAYEKLNSPESFGELVKKSLWRYDDGE